MFFEQYYKFFLIFLFFLLLMIFFVLNNSTRIDINSYNIILGIPYTLTMSLLEFVWMMFQIFLTLYFCYSLFSYENNNSPEFLILRKSKKNIMIEKILLAITSIAIFRTFIFLLIYIIINSVKNSLLFVFSFNILIHIFQLVISFIVYILFDD